MTKQIAEFDKIKFLADTIAKAINPKRIYLFGSFARGEQTEGSDYDFCVIVDDRVDDTHLLAANAYQAIYGFDFRSVDIVVIREKTFNKLKSYPTFIQYYVNKEGVPLYE